MTAEARIRVGSGVGIGTVTLDAEHPMRGEGGPHDARVVLQFHITMNPRPREQMIALLNLSCSLHLTGSTTNAGPHNQLGQAVATNLISEFPCRSLPDGPSASSFAVQFPVSPLQIANLERYRHEQPEAAFRATLCLSATVGWLIEITSKAVEGGHPFGTNMGLLSQVIPFWTTKVEDLSMRIPASTWMSEVLPGLDLDRMRLVEVAMPQRDGVFPQEIFGYFDSAQRNFDQARYRDCMVSCRDVRNAIENHLGATEKNPVASVVEKRLQLPAGSQQGQLLTKMWETLRFETNVAAHLPGGPRLTEADARACLHLTAIVVEYLGQLLQ